MPAPGQALTYACTDGRTTRKHNVAATHRMSDGGIIKHRRSFITVPYGTNQFTWIQPEVLYVQTWLPPSPNLSVLHNPSNNPLFHPVILIELYPATLNFDLKIVTMNRHVICLTKVKGHLVQNLTSGPTYPGIEKIKSHARKPAVDKKYMYSLVCCMPICTIYRYRYRAIGLHVYYFDDL